VQKIIKIHMEIIGLKSKLIESGDDLMEIFIDSLESAGEKVKDGDIVVVSSKIVALSEGRLIDLNNIKPSDEAIKLAKETYDRTIIEDPRFTELVMREADYILPGKLHLTLTDNILIPAAGIDRSNVPKEKVVLWPEDSQRSADNLRHEMLSRIGRQENLEENTNGNINLGVIVADSHCQPMRKGVIGIALAWSGFEGIEDVRGELDLYGKKLSVTQKGVADNLSCAATAVMGEGNDSIPFVIIRDANVKFTDKQQNNLDNFFPPSHCIFEGIYSNEVKDLVKTV